MSVLVNAAFVQVFKEAKSVGSLGTRATGECCDLNLDLLVE